MKKLFTLLAVALISTIGTAQDTTDCYLNANFTYSTDGETIYFTNTSTDEPAAANYDWWVSPLSSTEENPSFLITDLEDPTTACFTVYNDDWTCYDSLCMLITFDEDSVIIIDSTDCYLHASFTYSTDGEYVYFTNTSTDEPADANYDWWVAPFSSSEENPSFLLADLLTPITTCLIVSNADGTCLDTACYDILFIEDSTAYLGTIARTEFKVYPNPAANDLTVEFSSTSGLTHLFIQNALGEIVLIELLGENGSKLQLDVSSLPNGIYIVTMLNTNSEEAIVPVKFIKQ